MVKEVILDRPFECNIDMNFILTNLDKIIARHTESEVQTQSKPQTLLAVESSESKEHNIIAVRKNPTPFLPKINTFLTAAVGNILYEQGEYTDIGTLDKGESIHGSKESRAN
ncbi:hypothetical protein [Paenibacillus sp. SC116]|uniref:hypothetical protein n=1 Tax=Paenibacillus sp. SC116 TaxID=2968986 RepID=UPI00215B5FA3|nr:hypothetical protein [Paenibacillus sp. SC116]